VTQRGFCFAIKFKTYILGEERNHCPIIHRTPKICSLWRASGNC